MSRRRAPSKPYHAAWLLLVVFAWVMQPLGTELCCHDDIASAHASAEHHGANHHSVNQGHDHGASHSHEGSHTHHASTPVTDHAGGNTPQPAQDACCCQPHETHVTVASAFNFSSPDKKSLIVATSTAILAVAYELQAPPTISSRAGPDVAIPPALLRSSAFSNRAPPFSA